MKKRNYKIMVMGLILTTAFMLTGCQGKDSSAQKAAAVASSSEENTGSIDKNKKKYVLNLGEVKELMISDTEIISCTSNKPEVVSVSKEGVLHAKKQGKVRITVKSKQDDDTVKSRVYHVKVKKRGMVYPIFSMMKGEHLDMQFSIDGVNAVWKSSNPKIARVSKAGKVIAQKKGFVKLTAKAEDGKEYRCDLKITKKIKNIIYLTFDDGPNRYSTTKILNILKKNHIKATFFELKPAEKDFDLTKRVIDEGHTLALHGYQHKYDIVYKSQKIYHENLDKLRDLFFKKFGIWCTISRFPGGSSNTRSSYNPGIMTKLTGKLHDWGYHYFDWNVDSGDAGGARSAKDTFNNFKNGLRKGCGNVVLMHDYYKNDKTIDALEKMIRYGKKQGYTFLPITASTDEVHHHVNN